MIPAYFQSLAATVRDLVASGKAVHVTNETAAELDLLAGLPWGSLVVGHLAGTAQPVRVTEKGEAAPMITPADLALGWLLASRVESVEWASGDRHWGLAYVGASVLRRAAECAELAKEAAQLLVLERAAQIVPMPWTAETMGPYLADLRAATIGTREGARAAWGFVASNRSLAQSLMDVCDRYRRELEAM